MKKYISLLAALLCLCLLACSNDSSDISKSESNNSFDMSTNVPSRPELDSFSFDSLSEFKSFVNQDEELYIALSEKGVNSEIVDTVKVFVEKIKSGSCVFPLHNEKIMELGNADISFYIREAYDLPCVFYHPYVSTGENFYIKMTYISDDVLEKLKTPTASEVLKELAPNGANINNLGDQHKSTYNQKIQLADCEVEALVYEFKTDNRNSFRFVYDDMLVEIRCDPVVWNAEWFSSLSFGSID